MEPDDTSPDTEPDPDDDENFIADDLFPLVYDELRNIARSKMELEPGVQTLSATALVHEVYLRMTKKEKHFKWANRRQFFSVAAEAMRRILIERARTKLSVKRGGEFKRDALYESQIEMPVEENEILAVNEALEELERVDEESAELVKLRYFAGMKWDEISETVNIPARTLRRQWTYTRAWLKEWLTRNLRSA